MKIKELNLGVKNLNDSGNFEGYGSIFNTVDYDGEVVVRGAFAKSLSKHQNRGASVVMLWQHQLDSPIGVWKNLREDDQGLIGEGEINLEVRKGREAYSLMRQGALTGLSIGYDEVKTRDEGNIRMLEELELYEISPVTFPANCDARISTVKSQRLGQFAQKLRDGEPLPIKEFEEILREAGVPKKMATQIASVGYAKAIRSESESDKANVAAAFFRELSGAY